MQDFLPQSKVWVYQADRFFTNEETEKLNHYITQFTAQWTAHNHQLLAGGEVRYNRFIILIVDESQAGASGCSIDKSVHFLKEIEKEFGVSLFERQQIAYRSGNEIQTAAMAGFDDLAAQGLVNEGTVVFNNTVTTKAQLDSQWETALKNTWLKRYLPAKQPVS